MNFFNHYAYGAVGAWMYANIGGIDIGQPGYKHIVMSPRPGGGITSANATLECMYGEIFSEWRIESNTSKWRIVIPPNTTATAYLPDESAVELDSGITYLTKKWDL